MIHALLIRFKDVFILFLSNINRRIRKKTQWFFYFDTIIDNSKYLMEYISENTKDKIICYTTNKEYDENVDNERLVYTNSIIELFYYLLTSKYVITSFDHRYRIKPARGQRIVHLMHGCTLKDCGHDFLLDETRRRGNYYTDILCHGKNWEEIYCKAFGCEKNQLRHWDNPRNDLLFRPAEKTVIEIFFEMKFDNLILWLPTYRQSKFLKSVDSSISIPIINQSNIDLINEKLRLNNSVLIIKPHPKQNDLSNVVRNKSNIKLISDSDIKRMGIENYQFFACSDALITDYSSVYFDYLLLDKPIAFAIDDFQDYSQNRGFAFDNPKDYMPGVFVINTDELCEFLSNPLMENEKYRCQRHRVRSLFYWSDDHNCERVYNDIINSEL